MGRGVGLQQRPAVAVGLSRTAPLAPSPLEPVPGVLSPLPVRPMLPGNALDVATGDHRPVQLSWATWFGHITRGHIGQHLHLQGERPRPWVFFPDYRRQDAMDLVLDVIAATLEQPDRIRRQMSDEGPRLSYIREFLPPVVLGPGPRPVVIVVSLQTGQVMTAFPSTRPDHQAWWVPSAAETVIWPRPAGSEAGAPAAEAPPPLPN